jgi:hypothetical protein
MTYTITLALCHWSPAIKNETMIGLAGNTFIAKPVRRYQNPAFLAACDYMRGLDVTLANVDCAIPDPEDPPAFVAGSGWGATYMVGTPDMVDDLKFMGIDGVCAANKDVSDFGDAGILSTVRTLRRMGMPTQASERA